MRSSLALRIAGFTVAAALLFPNLAVAATFERMDLDRLTFGAEQIFAGTAASASSRFAGRQIVTDFTFVDVEVIKGELSEPSPKVRMLGGTMGDMSLAIPGAPTFQLGRRYLVFINGNGTVMFPTLGGSQGIFELRQDVPGGAMTMHDYAGRAITPPPIAASESASQEKATSWGPEASVSPKAVTKEAFVGEIRKRLGQHQ